MISSRSGRLSLAVIGAAALTSGLVASPVSAENHASTTPARVFAPNPVQTTGDQSLTDQKDSAAAVPASAYYDVMLTNLDGSGTLTGDWANIRGENGKPVRFEPGETLAFDRSQDEFEQVMAYFWVTEAQKYIQSLGFGGDGDLDAVNMESQDLRISQYGIDNSYSWDKHDVIRLGKGGVDDAEDAEVIVHEYGHAVHDSQIAGWGGSLDAGAIGEAFGDYLAVTVGLAVADEVGAPVNANPACVADWDAVSYTDAPHCLRRIDRDLTVEDRRNQVHFDGQIWSRALWDIRGELGATVADRIIINAQFDFAPDTSFADAAAATVATAADMYDAATAAVVQQAFEDRGIF